MRVGENVPVTPLGSPLTDSTTAERKPFTHVVVAVITPDPPGATLTLAELTDKLSDGVRTVSCTLRLFVVPPPAALTVTLQFPGAATALAVKVSTELPLPGAAMLGWLNPAVTPAGSPVALRLTAELNPAPPAVVAVIVTDPPGATLALAAPAERANEGGGVTVSATV